MNEKDSIYMSVVVANLWLHDEIDSAVMDKLFDMIEERSEGDVLDTVCSIKSAVI